MTSKSNKIDAINEHFKLPIHYNSSKIRLKQNIIDDLEMVKTVDASSNPIYSFCLDNNSDLSKTIIQQASEYYTTDVSFLKDTQQLLTSYTNLPNKYTTNVSNDYSKITAIWNDVKGDNGFKEKYYYVDWAMLEFLNKSDTFLQLMSLYNLASPVISFLIPIIILIIPFFVIRVKGVSLSMNEYIDVLKTVVSNHAIGKLFTKFADVSMNERIYLILSAGFYLFSIYQNVLVCVRFNNNMKKIHAYFDDIDEYLTYTIASMNNYLIYSNSLQSYAAFNETVREKMTRLIDYQEKFRSVTAYKYTNYKKIFEIGHILKTFYELYEDPTYNDAFMYSFGFNGYLDCVEQLRNNIQESKMSFADFIDDNKKAVIKNNYYACLKDEPNVVKNTIKMKKNMIITGPNASGKTTILKSVLINVILTQQFGCGFYESAKLKPFKYIHCYLNIPDTSGRDSLFQAEARRCKEIIDIVDANTNKEDGHFAIFDELYSGTNPDEAVASATAFMEYLMKKHNVSCMLTTHFVKVCKRLKTNPNVINCHMDTKMIDDKMKYTYRLKNGISTVKGGVNILCDLNYPAEIIKSSILSTFSTFKKGGAKSLEKVD